MTVNILDAASEDIYDGYCFYEKRQPGYQAGSCDYGMRDFIENVRRKLNRPSLSETAGPSGMVKDVVLPKYRVPEF